MTEEQKPSPESPGEEQTASSEVLGEIQSLGRQLAQAVKSLWESEESRELRKEIGDGFVELGRQMETAVKSAQDSEAVHKFEEQVKETVSKARESDIAAKLEQGLVSGLRELNEQLAKLLPSTEKGEEGTEPEGEAGA